MIKAVLFDYDGTIVDTNEIILGSWRHLYKTLTGRVCRDEEVVGTFGEVLDDTLAEKFPGYDVEMLKKIYRDYQKDIFYEAIQLCPGMDELIPGLKEKGIKIAIVTSRVTSSTLQGLSKFGLDNAFDTIVTCEDTDEHKPSPVPCRIALDKLGVSADEAIMIGDSKLDIQCAHNAGVKAVLVNWTICAPESVRIGNSKPDWVVDTSTEIFGIIDTAC